MDTSDTTRGCKQGEQEEGKIIDLPLRLPGEEPEKTDLQRFIEQFQICYTSLADAALRFREQISVSPATCQSVIIALQGMRRQTNACLEFLGSNRASFVGKATYLSPVTICLELLDGEKTARLILEMSLFESFARKSSSEDLSQAKQRITQHITLQKSLKSEATDLRSLIGKLEQLLAATPLPPVPCKNAGSNFKEETALEQ